MSSLNYLFTNSGIGKRLLDTPANLLCVISLWLVTTTTSCSSLLIVLAYLFLDLRLPHGPDPDPELVRLKLRRSLSLLAQRSAAATVHHYWQVVTILKMKLLHFQQLRRREGISQVMMAGCC